ncbi:hypothetical protein COV16_01045 [Candidatus Woesearchaeota archaeon CG10_big_fil_rev_8_21_14_0_10_34_8]|nr:MAG: hypothetical protein COV16_01045 [Candidatus Woesearchaeota archaeon CG10_big_fil_rev_8_21_14_0_10_34_8]
MEQKAEENKTNVLDKYKLNVNNIMVEVNIVFYPEDAVPQYIVNITNMSKTTKIILEKIREEFISEIGAGVVELSETGGVETIKVEFKKELTKLLNKYFPNADEQTKDMLINYVIEQNLGLGNIEILLKDDKIEEIVVNSAKEPVWVYHKKHAWLKTNISLPSEARVRHFATMIGRDVNKEISTLHPLMDAHLLTGDRVNATLEPVSSFGNTITIRKFATDPWTITDFIRSKTIDLETAALIWLCMQHELSIVISGGTGSGKTSMLNVISSFLPPNQRTISIEDTRELQLPNTLHWVPLETRLPNPEGKGGVSMLDLIINSLRMRPDRIIMGEIRRQKEAETLFEALHTGHSCYATFHANDVRETITRLTNPPINIPKLVLPAMNCIVVQNRNRRTNKRRTMQFAEILPNGEPNVIRQYDPLDDTMKTVGRMNVIPQILRTYTGMTPQMLQQDIQKKIRILQWMIDHNVRNLNDIGILMSKYYRDKLVLK